MKDKIARQQIELTRQAIQEVLRQIRGDKRSQVCCYDKINEVGVFGAWRSIKDVDDSMLDLFDRIKALEEYLGIEYK
jgi:hypothetical protein